MEQSRHKYSYDSFYTRPQEKKIRLSNKQVNLRSKRYRKRMSRDRMIQRQSKTLNLLVLPVITCLSLPVFRVPVTCKSGTMPRPSFSSWKICSLSVHRDHGMNNFAFRNHFKIRSFFSLPQPKHGVYICINTLKN